MSALALAVPYLVGLYCLLRTMFLDREARQQLATLASAVSASQQLRQLKTTLDTINYTGGWNPEEMADKILTTPWMHGKCVELHHLFFMFKHHFSYPKSANVAQGLRWFADVASKIDDAAEDFIYSTLYSNKKSNGKYEEKYTGTLKSIRACIDERIQLEETKRRYQLVEKDEQPRIV